MIKKHIALFMISILFLFLMFGCDINLGETEPILTTPILTEPNIPTPTPTMPIPSMVDPTEVVELPDPTYSFDESLYQGYELLLRKNVKAWGLGNIVLKYQTNDRDYEWYKDQLSSSLHPTVNCGPTSVEMVGRFIDQHFEYTTDDFRRLYYNNGGWWYGSDIAGALDLSSIAFKYTFINHEDSLKQIIDQGHIAILNNNMSLIPRNSRLIERTNRFYSGVTGHYFVLKGYVETDLGIFFEVYDPYSYFMTYDEDGTLKGKNRYYESEALLHSLRNWYQYAFEILGKK
jgi:hypothetical protein